VKKEIFESDLKEEDEDLDYDDEDDADGCGEGGEDGTGWCEVMKRSPAEGGGVVHRRTDRGVIPDDDGGIGVRSYQAIHRMRASFEGGGDESGQGGVPRAKAVGYLSFSRREVIITV
jgi:hypothetical protein